MTNPCYAGPQRVEILRTLRNRCRGKVAVSGIYLVVHFRTVQDADCLTHWIGRLGGQAFHTKVRKAQYTGDLTHRVEFTIGIDEDAYIEGRNRLRVGADGHPVFTY